MKNNQGDMGQREVNAITGRLSLRAPQHESLKQLASAIEAAPAMLTNERSEVEVVALALALAPTLLSAEVGADANNPHSLLVCCASYRGMTAGQAAARWPNLTLKKIPKIVKNRCEWGHDDYSLNVASLPMAQKPAAETAAQDDLFAGDAE